MPIDQPFGLPAGLEYGMADVQVFTTGGTFSWTRPPADAYRMVRVICFGAGGGGGGGEVRANNCGGGGGGGGGAICVNEFPIIYFAAEETVVVGAGGAFGAGVSIASNGNTGSAGANSSMTINGVVAVRATGGL